MSKKLINIISDTKGWLALFYFCIGLGALLRIIHLILYIASVLYIYSNMGIPDNNIFTSISMIGFTIWLRIIIETIMIGFGVYVFILIKKHKSLAIKLAIIFLILNAITIVINYDLAWLISNNFNLIKMLLNDQMHTAISIGLGIIPATIWIPYFLKSKSAKSTLKNE